MVGVLLEYLIMTACSDHFVAPVIESHAFFFPSTYVMLAHGKKRTSAGCKETRGVTPGFQIFCYFIDLLPESGGSVKISSRCSDLLQEFDRRGADAVITLC